MKPSSLATVLLRLAAFYIIISGVLMACGVIIMNFFMDSMIERNGFPGTLTGSVFNFNFPVSSVQTLFGIQITAALLVVAAGIFLFKISRAIGLWIGSGLEPREESPPASAPWKPRPSEPWKR